jgi:hypothetical protein
MLLADERGAATFGRGARVDATLKTHESKPDNEERLCM